MLGNEHLDIVLEILHFSSIQRYVIGRVAELRINLKSNLESFNWINNAEYLEDVANPTNKAS